MVTIPDQSYSAKFGEYFSQQINGGDGVYTFSSGNFPPGLSLSETGLISGNIESLNSWSFVVKAGSNFGGYSYGNISILATPGTPIILENQTLTGFYESEFSQIIVGHLPSYGPKEFLLEDEGNRQVSNWQITGLPSWATLNSTTGAITGIPTARGTHPVTINVSGPGGTDSTTGTIFIDYGWPILAAGQIFYGKAGETFSQTPALVDSENRLATAWDVYPLGPQLPTGLTINSTTGVITGTPTQTGSRVVYIRVSGPGGADPSDTQVNNGQSYYIGKGLTISITKDRLFAGPPAATAVYAGATPATSVYYGSKKLWPATV
jgi:hypothetical protein